MQISVAPNSTASSTRRAKSASSCSYASGERRPCPKPQNAQPTVQMFDRLMLRLTTNVTVSPASSPRSSSAAWRMSSIASGRVSANRAVSSSGESEPPSRARAIAPGTSSRRIGRSSRRPEPLRGMKLQYFSFTRSSTPCSSHCGSMYCGYTHRRSVSAYPSGASRLRILCTDGNGCSGEM